MCFQPHDTFPEAKCTCGLYGWRSPDWEALASWRMYAEDPGPALITRAPVVGSVRLWGRVLEHEWGYRASYARAHNVRLACPLCLDRGYPGEVRWILKQPVGRPDGAGWLPLCDQHIEAVLTAFPRHRHRLERTLPARQGSTLEAYIHRQDGGGMASGDQDRNLDLGTLGEDLTLSRGSPQARSGAMAKDPKRRPQLTEAALNRFAEGTKDLGDPEVMAAAWR